MKFTKISEQHIRDAIDKTKTSKGFGNDNISSYFLNLSNRFTLWKAQFHNKSDDENDEEKSHFLR